MRISNKYNIFKRIINHHKTKGNSVLSVFVAYICVSTTYMWSVLISCFSYLALNTQCVYTNIVYLDTYMNIEGIHISIYTFWEILLFPISDFPFSFSLYKQIWKFWMQQSTQITCRDVSIAIGVCTYTLYTYISVHLFVDFSIHTRSANDEFTSTFL